MFASSLWKSSLGGHKRDAHDHERTYLRAQYLAMREKVEVLVRGIQTDMPWLTVHDITHLDALWEMASLASGRGYPLNPAEAFVLGGAILLHDSAMTIAAFENGIDDLKNTLEWKDIAALQLEGGAVESDEQNHRDIVSKTLRLLHAKQAEQLAVTSWPVPGEKRSSEFLIDDGELRTFYGPSMGIVARSHWWSVPELEVNLPKEVGPSRKLPEGWQVDLVKLACLLRVADVLHMDARRAPRFAYALAKPQGVSDLHWRFQNRLSKPRIAGDTIIFSSGPSFKRDDADAWRLAFQSINAANHELRNVDLLLEATQRPRLRARNIRGADDPNQFSQYVRVEGWKPVNAEIRVAQPGNIIATVVDTMLEEEKNSYGLCTALRELIQNASDAVRARRKLINESAEWGAIEVSLRGNQGNWYLDVEDTGIGMSERILVGPLLEFGTSGWRGEVAEEFPGLMSSGMKATGRYGIGFYSAFSIGQEVKIISRRFDRSASDTLVLEFSDGLRRSPILRSADHDEVLLEGGTCISIKLDRDPYGEKSDLLPFYRDLHADTGSNLSLAATLAEIAPALDTRLIANEQGQVHLAAAANDWITIPATELIQRLYPNSSDAVVSSVANDFMRPLVSPNGEVLGRLCLLPQSSIGAVVCVGGLSAGHKYGSVLTKFVGTIFGTPASPLRNRVNIDVPDRSVADWATQQAKLIGSSQWAPNYQHACAEIVLLCGGDSGSLPIVRHGKAYLNKYEFGERVDQEKKLRFLQSDSEASTFHDRIPLFVTPSFSRPGTRSWGSSPTGASLRGLHFDNQRPRSCREAALSVIRERWGTEVTPQFLHSNGVVVAEIERPQRRG